MGIEDHPQWDEVKRRFGIEDNDATEAMVHGRMMNATPDARAKLVYETENAVLDDPGTNLRQKAQLLSFARELRNTHHTLKRAGR